MTPKNKITAFISRLPDDVTTDQLLEKLDLFRSVEIGLQQVSRGEYVEHEDLFDELLNDEAQSKGRLDAAGKGKSAGDKGLHRQRFAKNGEEPESFN